MGTDEYVVESVQRAQVVANGRKKAWNFFVKWKDYGYKDNTWEPITSFKGGSEHFVTHFWERIDVDGRDVDDLSQFKIGEEFFPKGPPRRQLSTRKSTSNIRQAPSSKPSPDSEREVHSLIGDDHDAPVTRSKTTSQPTQIASGAKRKRGRKSTTLENSDTAPPEPSPERMVTRRQSATNLTRTPKVAAAHQTSSTSRKTAQLLKTPARKSKRQKTSQEDSSDELLLKPDGTESTRRKSSGLPKKPRTSPEQPLFSDPEPMEQDDAEGFGIPVLLVPDSTVAESSTSAVPIEATPALPSHRARAANPKVKRFEEPLLGLDEGSGNAIHVKAKFMKHPITAGDSEPSTSQIPPNRTHAPVENLTTAYDSISAARIPRSKTGPGRLSNGVVTGSTSLLMFKDGGLTTVKGRRIQPPKRFDDLMDEMQQKFASNKSDSDADKMRMSGTPLSLGDGSVFQVVERSLNPDFAYSLDDAEQATEEMMYTVPTAQELFQLAGLNSEDAEELPDYDEDEDAHGEPDPDIEIPISMSQNTHTPNSAVVSSRESTDQNGEVPTAVAVVSGSAVVVENEYEKSLQPQPVATFKHYSAMMFGAPVPVKAAATANCGDSTNNSSDPPRTHLSLKLDFAVSISVDLKDPFPPQSYLGNLPTKTIIQGTPGKFYNEQNGVTLLDALRMKGSFARVVLDIAADDSQKQHFERFQSRLRAGYLFVLPFSDIILALCFSENRTLCEKIGMPANLSGLGDSILVAHAEIASQASYIDALDLVETGRWSA